MAEKLKMSLFLVFSCKTKRVTESINILIQPKRRNIYMLEIIDIFCIFRTHIVIMTREVVNDMTQLPA